MARRRRLTTGEKIVMLLAAVGFLAFTAWIYAGSAVRQREFALARAGEAEVDGPPCPVITREAFEARQLKKTRATLYEGVTFTRQFGHMDCSALRYGGGWSSATYPVCQFTGPGLMKIATPKGDWYFAPPPGQPATVAAPKGQARCVLDSNFTMRSLVGG
jgi:hypothetical protein